MTNDKKDKVYDLEERTAKFGGAVIAFAKQAPKNIVTAPVIDQLVRSGTSIGANYCEADCAESKKDFEHKLGICKKEAKETRYWLRMIAAAESETKAKARELWHEANELLLIFTAIIKKSRAHRP